MAILNNSMKIDKKIIFFLLVILTGLSLATMAWAESNDKKIDKNKASEIGLETIKKLNPESNISKVQLKDAKFGKQTVWEIISENGEEIIYLNTDNGELIFLLNTRKHSVSSAVYGDSVTSNVYGDPVSSTVYGESVISNVYGDSVSSTVYGDSVTSAVYDDYVLNSARIKAGELSLFLPQNDPHKEIKRGDEWMLSWFREQNGYKYHDDWVSIFITDSGEIKGYNKNYSSEKLLNINIKIDKAQALSIAEEICSQNQFTISSKETELMIVNPNYRWTSNFIEYPGSETKLAWVVSFDKLEGWGEIWIDTLTGSILGGIETI